ncbi:helix-turn-helix transcriptional regulator [Pseudonocardia sp. KRD-291]|nr:LuxR C-terminal-related transcriptional regulator [Pseudonocardia sp. KRD291]MBW0103926.1 helix-turn-helix transcriptional regulator [Pseudonocardia sp. KRD291]
MFSTALQNALCDEGLDAHVVPVSDHDTMLGAAGRYDAGVVLLDLAPARDAGGRRIRSAALVATLSSQGKSVLVVVGRRDDDAAAAAIAAGAVGVVSKSVSLQTLLRILLRASAGLPVMTDTDRDLWLARHRHREESRRDRTERLRRLSPRERQVLDLLATGQRAAMIAEQCGLATATVRSQVSSVLAKLEVSSQLEAVALLFEARAGLDSEWDR